jgi:hypothetical protein
MQIVDFLSHQGFNSRPRSARNASTHGLTSCSNNSFERPVIMSESVSGGVQMGRSISEFDCSRWRAIVNMALPPRIGSLKEERPGAFRGAHYPHIAFDCKQHCEGGELVSVARLRSPTWGRQETLPPRGAAPGLACGERPPTDRLGTLVQAVAKRLIPMQQRPDPPGYESDTRYKARSAPPLPIETVWSALRRNATPALAFRP